MRWTAGKNLKIPFFKCHLPFWWLWNRFSAPNVRSLPIGDGHFMMRSFRFRPTYNFNWIHRAFEICWQSYSVLLRQVMTCIGAWTTCQRFPTTCESISRCASMPGISLRGSGSMTSVYAVFSFDPIVLPAFTNTWLLRSMLSISVVVRRRNRFWTIVLFKIWLCARPLVNHIHLLCGCKISFVL